MSSCITNPDIILEICHQTCTFCFYIIMYRGDGSAMMCTYARRPRVLDFLIWFHQLSKHKTSGTMQPMNPFRLNSLSSESITQKYASCNFVLSMMTTVWSKRVYRLCCPACFILAMLNGSCTRRIPWAPTLGKQFIWSCCIGMPC